MTKSHALTILGIPIVLFSLASCAPLQPWAQPYQQGYPNGGMGGGGGMMGGGGPGGGMMGGGGAGGMMGPGVGSGGMMGGGGPGGGMMGTGTGSGIPGPGAGGYGSANPQARSLTIDQAADAVRRYLDRYGGSLALTEVTEFAWNFYAELAEKDTGVRAMELLVDKYSGQVYPETGPNVAWNAKYGVMRGAIGGNSGIPTPEMSVSPEQAKALAQRFLDGQLPGVTVAEAELFYGYYTLHTLRNGKVEGMLSVNGYTGAAWYHDWHGPFVTIKEFDKAGGRGGQAG